MKNLLVKGGGGEERGGDACIAQARVASSHRGDASIPSPLLTAPAPTRLVASEDAGQGHSQNTYPCKTRGTRLCTLTNLSGPP